MCQIQTGNILQMLTLYRQINAAYQYLLNSFITFMARLYFFFGQNTKVPVILALINCALDTMHTKLRKIYFSNFFLLHTQKKTPLQSTPLPIFHGGKSQQIPQKYLQDTDFLLMSCSNALSQECHFQNLQQHQAFFQY